LVDSEDRIFRSRQRLKSMISRIRRGIRRLQDCVRWGGFDVAAKLRRRAEMFERLKCSWHGGEEEGKTTPYNLV
jgi:hypothetical protein